MGNAQRLRPRLLEALGQKAKQGVDMLSETGTALFSAYETMAPLSNQAAAFLSYVFKNIPLVEYNVSYNDFRETRQQC